MKFQHCVASLVALGLVTAAIANPRPPKETTSENERFTLRLELGRPGTHRTCIATLTDREQAEKRGEVWKRSLVNEIAPARVLIRNDGKFVVTLDEYRRGGARNALVIYGRRGELLRHFLLTDLLKREDWQRVRVRRGAVDWLSGARFGFEESPEEFVVTLRGNRLIRIDLNSLRVIDGPDPDDNDDGVVPADVLAALSSGRDGRGSDVAADETLETRLEKLLAAEGLQADQISDEQYRELFTKLLASEADKTQTAEKELATANPGERPDTADSEPGDNLAAATREQQIARAAEEDAAYRRMRERLATAANLGDNVQNDDGTTTAADAAVTLLPDGRLPAGLSGLSDVPVPQPDPTNPVNYVEWYNNLTQTDDPSAVPFYQAAAESFVPFAGDAELLDAAMKGDGDALASPEITAWLESNRAALARLQEGNELSYRGTPAQSDSGYLVGILLPNLSPLRQLSRVAVLEGKRAELDGRPQDAVNSYLTAIKAGAQVSHGVTLIEQLVGVAQQRVGAEALLDALARTHAAPLDYESLAQRLESEYRPLRPMASAIQGERAMMLDLVQTSFERDPETSDYRVRPDALLRFHSLMQSDDDPLSVTMTAMSLATKGYQGTLDSINRMYDRLTGAAAASYPRGNAELQAISAEIESPQFRATEPLMAQLLPALNRANTVRTRADAQRAATLTVANILAYQQRNGRLPESLDVLGEKPFVIDPFTGQRFIYRHNGDDEFSLYSASGNGMDDGGIEGVMEDEGDLVYWPRKR